MRKALVVLAVLSFSRPNPCAKKTAALDASADATVADASVASVAPPPPPPPPPPPDPSLETAKAAFSDIEWDVAHSAMKDKTKTGEPDANAQCAAIDELRPKLESKPEPEVRRMLDESKRLCAYDVPIISANETLRQVSVSPSQASRRLMCKYAAKDIAKAKAVKSDDRKVRELDLKWQRTCAL
jgi:hypothetical protein